MNLKELVLSTFCTALLGISFLPLAYSSAFADAFQIAQQTQETSINLRSEDLNEPLLLRVRGSADLQELTGRIELDGKLLKKINNNPTEINLSSYLNRGRNTLTILGKYDPASASIQIELSGKNTQVNQETSGSGKINQTLTIEVE